MNLLKLEEIYIVKNLKIAKLSKGDKETIFCNGKSIAAALP
jgi:hypothetical protein